MTWFRVDDRFYDHPKFYDAPDCVVALWTRAGSWIAAHETDGYIPGGIAARFCEDPERATAWLVERGIWEPVGDRYAWHDWADYNPTKQDLDNERKARRERQARWRAGKRRPDDDASTPDGKPDDGDASTHKPERRDGDASTGPTWENSEPVDTSPTPVDTSPTDIRTRDSRPGPFPTGTGRGKGQVEGARARSRSRSAAPAASEPARPNACGFCGSFEHITARCEARDLAQDDAEERARAARAEGKPEPPRRPGAASPPGVAERGGALARRLLDEARAEREPGPGAEPGPTDPQARARAQVEQARAERAADPTPEPEPDPDDLPPF